MNEIDEQIERLFFSATNALEKYDGKRVRYCIPESAGPRIGCIKVLDRLTVDDKVRVIVVEDNIAMSQYSRADFQWCLSEEDFRKIRPSNDDVVDYDLTQ